MLGAEWRSVREVVNRIAGAGAGAGAIAAGLGDTHGQGVVDLIYLSGYGGSLYYILTLPFEYFIIVH